MSEGAGLRERIKKQLEIDDAFVKEAKELKDNHYRAARRELKVFWPPFQKGGEI